jgi:Putative abortive phage resistance protein AbiGi, antitoxin
MALYPDILFHFTTKQSLENILSETFKVSYARERIHGGRKRKEFAVPMVSFSDLRLSELKKNIGTYGKFGIGMTKEWAIRKGLNPVMYASKESLFTANFISGIEDLFKLVAKSNDTTGRFETAYNNTINTLRYIKNYKGDLIRPDKPIMRNYVFANEREWRYVPPISDDYLAFVSIDRIETSEQKAEFNSQVEHLKLSFQPDDIKYLIVETESDINPLITHLRQVKNRFLADTLDRLASRILTYEQIENDI